MKTLVLGLLLSSPLAAAPDEAKILKALLPQEPCVQAYLNAKDGPTQYRFFEAEDLEAHWFLMLRQGPKHVLLELLLEPKAPAKVVERRAWHWRNGQRRLMTEADGLADCETRWAVPLERLEKAWKQALKKGRWKTAPKIEKSLKNKSKS